MSLPLTGRRSGNRVVAHTTLSAPDGGYRIRWLLNALVRARTLVHVSDGGSSRTAQVLRGLVTALPFFAHRVLRLEVTELALSDGLELESVGLLLGGDVMVP